MPSNCGARRSAALRRREEAEARRIQELQALAAREDEAWREVVMLIEKKTGPTYDKAVDLLLRLRDLADYQGRMVEFHARVTDLQRRYAGRSALQRRLWRSGLV